jgi:hypothetical protein
VQLQIQVSIKLEDEETIVGYLLETVGEGEDILKMALENGRIVNMSMPTLCQCHEKH